MFEQHCIKSLGSSQFELGLRVAQLVECGSGKPNVLGSNPRWSDNCSHSDLTVWEIQIIMFTTEKPT